MTVSYRQKTGAPTQYLDINNAATDTELVAAQPGQIIVVHGLFLSTATATTFQLVSDGSGDTELISFRTNLTTSGSIPPVTLPVTELGWTATNAGEALDLRQAGSNDIDGCLVYSVQTAAS